MSGVFGGGLGETQYERELEEELQAMRNLVAHIKTHGTRGRHGYDSMDDEMKSLYDRINRDGSLTIPLHEGVR